MAISDRDRKILWSQSYERCAICRRPLVEALTASDREAVVGEEAHIVARSPNGPRGGSTDPALIDDHTNLILLCPTHHRVVDAQPQEWSVEKLRETKARHQAWARARLDAPGHVRIVPHPDDPDLPDGNHLWPVTTGAQLWDIVAGASMYRLAGLEDDAVDDPELVDLVDNFLQEIRDLGDYYSAIEDSLAEVRELKRHLGSQLSGIYERGLLVFGARRKRLMTGGIGPDTEWAEIQLAVVQRDDPSIAYGPQPAGQREEPNATN